MEKVNNKEAIAVAMPSDPVGSSEGFSKVMFLYDKEMEEAGFTHLAAIKNLTESDLEGMGINKKGHVYIILDGIKTIRHWPSKEIKDLREEKKRDVERYMREENSEWVPLWCCMVFAFLALGVCLTVIGFVHDMHPWGFTGVGVLGVLFITCCCIPCVAET